MAKTKVLNLKNYIFWASTADKTLAMEIKKTEEKYYKDVMVEIRNGVFTIWVREPKK